MTAILVNLISALLGIIATYIGVTQQDTWSKHKRRPTKAGAIVIVLACSIAMLQISLETIQWKEKKKYTKLVEDAYNGWISVGLYDINNHQWDTSFLQGLQTSDTVIKNNHYIVKKELNIRIPPPDYCPDNDNTWYQNEAKTDNTLPKGGLVKIIEVKRYHDCGLKGKVPDNGKVRVLAKIVLISFP